LGRWLLPTVYTHSSSGIFPNRVSGYSYLQLFGIVLNFVFILIKPAWFGIDERQNINQ